MTQLKSLAGMVAAILLSAAPALAQHKMKIAAPHPTILPSTFSVIADEMGFYKKHGLEIEHLWTAGGADAQQATINGSVDLAVQTGLAGSLSAIQQGAPLVIVGSDMTGASDLYWFMRADKPFKTIADLGPSNTISFSRPGASSEMVARTLLEHYNSKARAVPSGSPPETLTQVMSGQIDVGWGTAPYPADIKSGKAKVIARGNDSPKLAGMTIRVHSVNASYLAKNPAAVKAFLKGYDDAINAVYNDPKAKAKAAQLIKVTPEEVDVFLKELFPRAAFRLDRIGDLDGAIAQAIANKQLKGPLSDAQKAQIQKTVAELNVK